MLRTLATVAAILLAAVTAGAAERIEGPLSADVVRVIDGDTLLVRAKVWLGTEVTVSVRIRGIDAPEKRSACTEERRAADRAAIGLAATIGDAPVTLTAVAGDKYAGRVLADVATASGTSVAGALLGAGLARTYAGGSRAPWCP